MSASPVDPGTLSLIGLGLQDRLQLVFPPTRFQFAWMPPRLSPKEWSRLVNRPPFIGLGWNEMTDAASGRRTFAGPSSWSVFLVIQNTNSMRARYLGDPQGPGLFQLVQAAIIALHGYTMPAVGSCAIKRAANAFAEGWEAENLAMAAVDVSVSGAMDVPSGLSGPDAVPELLAEIAASWSFADAGDAIQFNTQDMAA